MSTFFTKFYGATSLLSLLIISTSCASSRTSPRGSLPVPPRSSHNLGYMRPPYLPAAPTKVSWSSGRKDLKILAITFDDGPHPQNTPRLLDMLRKRNVKATFFTIGRSVDRYPAITQRIVREGHEIGNHTYTHANLSKLSESKVKQELNKGRDAIIRATQMTPTVMRPPYGALYKKQREWIKNSFGYPTILWSVDPLDWKIRNANSVSTKLINGARPGGILLAHDLHKTTVDAMPRTLDTLIAKGYKFVTVSELIQLTEQRIH